MRGTKLGPGRKDVLFLAHGAERGGPTRMLLALLRWLREHRDLDVEVALLRGGELVDELRALAPVSILEELDGAPVEDVGAWRSARTLRRRWRHLDGFALTYVSTAWSGRALAYLPRPSGRLLVHVHELELGFGRVLAERDRTRLLRDADRFVVGSEPVRRMLRSHGVAADRIALHPYFLVEEPRGFPAGGLARRRALGIPDGAAVVGTVAISDWRKGPDLLLEVAWHLRRLVPDRPVHLIWVGGATPGGIDATPTRDELRSLGLGDHVHFVGHQRALWDWYRAFDVFALPSREDAYPLACLEAAAVGVPTVCFDTGGIVDLVREDAGRIVPFPRVDLFAEAVAELLVHPDRRDLAGAAAAARVEAEHRIEVCAPGLADEVERLVAGP